MVHLTFAHFGQTQKCTILALSSEKFSLNNKQVIQIVPDDLSVILALMSSGLNASVSVEFCVDSVLFGDFYLNDFTEVFCRTELPLANCSFLWE